MKKLQLFISVLFILATVFSCHNNNSVVSTATSNSNQISSSLVDIPASAGKPQSGKLPKIVFTDTNFDFGAIKEGAKVTHVFTFKNEGQGDLVIANASASCGCTTPVYSRKVIHPGDTGTISVTFDSSNKSGKMVKLITLISNSQPPDNYLTINANIQPLNN